MFLNVIDSRRAVDDVGRARSAGGSMSDMDARALPRELGLVTRAQAQADGLSDRAIAWRIRSGRWQRLHDGVYATRPGPLGWLTRASGVLLACGTGAALADRSAAYVHKLLDEPGPLIWVVVPQARRVVQPIGARVRRARAFAAPGPQWPPRTTVEATLIDLASDASADDIAAWLARSLQRRITTAPRLLRSSAAEADTRSGRSFRR